MRAETTCHHCGAKMVEYKHSLSKALLRGFYRFVERAKCQPYIRVNLNDCDLTLNQRTNFYKLRYWGLVEKASDTNQRGGEWVLTTTGAKFARGTFPVPKFAWSYRGEQVRFEGEGKLIGEITGGWAYRPQYAQEAVPHG